MVDAREEHSTPMRGRSEELLERFVEYRRTGDRNLRNALIEEHRWIAVHCARRFDKRGEPLDDLVQVAQLGVLKAVERFDPEHGASFTTFAMPTVLGELRRHFRDATWALRVPRRMKDLHVELGGEIERLSQRLQRPPTIDEIAASLQVSTDDVLHAMEASSAYRAAPLTPPSDDEDPDDNTASEGTTLGGVDVGFTVADDRHELTELLASLPARQRQILHLRFFEELTQSEIADIVGISQVHVSRLLRASVEQLREVLDLPVAS
jgi:RNA polymerase sigma-B factor